MHTPTTVTALRSVARPARLARSASAALTCTIVAGGAHVVAGGRADPFVGASIFAGIWVVAATLTSRRLATSQLVGLLVAAQAAMHIACAGTAGDRGDGLMLATHLIGTALSAWMLRRGEDAFWTLAERLALRAMVVVTAATAVPPRRPTVALIVSSRSHRLAVLAHVIGRRGPPVGFA